MILKFLVEGFFYRGLPVVFRDCLESVGRGEKGCQDGSLNLVLLVADLEAFDPYDLTELSDDVEHHMDEVLYT